jgi:malate synthase
MEKYLDRAGLSVAEPLARFIEDQALTGTGIAAEAFWKGAAKIFATLAPENKALLQKRDALQAEIDAWHKERRGKPIDPKAYQDFLKGIGYLVPEPAPFQINVTKVDDELARVAGPQLVVPILNARFLLNAANARWGSLYDALYGTDAIEGAPLKGGYDPVRGGRVIQWAKGFLDRAVPLASGHHADVERYQIKDGKLSPALADPSLFAGYRGSAEAPSAILLSHHGLHIEIQIDRNHPIGKSDKAGVADILMESAVTTIADLEDSIAAVDGADKVAAYANWLGLMRGELEATFEKSGRALTRRLEPDRVYTAPNGGQVTLPGRSLMLIRNVGHLMTTPAVKLPDGQELPEGILDAIVTSLIGLSDLQRKGRFVNSRAGSIYIVKPKMHGSEEAAFTNRLFDAVEDLLGLARHTIKVGVMDEERRTSANLAATIASVKNRIVFINTGFLDRTGDEIHTSMQAGAMIRKGEMKNAAPRPTSLPPSHR